MNFVKVLKKVLRIGLQTAPVIVAAYNPPLGALISTVLSSVVYVEADQGAGNGPRKKELAMMGVQAAMPAIMAMLHEAGKNVKNPMLFASGTEKIMEGVVDIMNATGQVYKSDDRSPELDPEA